LYAHTDTLIEILYGYKLTRIEFIAGNKNALKSDLKITLVIRSKKLVVW